MVGIIGPSGAGKTTLVDLILRLFRPVQGRIFVDGRDVSEVNLEEWRTVIGYVSQDMFLLNDSIENNIRFYNHRLSMAAIEKAAKMANIYDFIVSCPGKFDSVIGDRGIMLSAGQRQRIIIARVLARQPKFLILDEATSALDNEAEKEIQTVIENLKGKITVLVIAHRLSTVINADRLMVLDDGRVIEDGPPAKLLGDKNSYFSRLYELRK
jgi:ABC-type multidrug transport system fused ATPase/permease subunit